MSYDALRSIGRMNSTLQFYSKILIHPRNQGKSPF